MAGKITWNDRELKATVARLRTDFEMSNAQAVNQITLDIVGRTFDNIPPHGGGNDIQGKRAEIKAIMNNQIATRVKRFTRGKRAGQFGRAVGRARELYSKNLIANYWRGKLGKKGLYGDAMKRYAGAMAGRRQRGVGSLKAVFIPVIRALNRVCKFKVPADKTSRIARWPGSRADGVAKLATPKDTKAEFLVGYKEKSSMGPEVKAIYEAAGAEAFDWKRGHMMRDVERELTPVIEGANSHG